MQLRYLQILPYLEIIISVDNDAQIVRFKSVSFKFEVVEINLKEILLYYSKS